MLKIVLSMFEYKPNKIKNKFMYFLFEVNIKNISKDSI